MLKKITITPSTVARVEVTPSTQPRLDPDQVAAALGAAGPGEPVERGSPVSLLAVRLELTRRLQSSGGRPALSDATRRSKIPLSDEEWGQLEKVAAALAAPGFTPSPGQVASVLLRWSLTKVTAELAAIEAGQASSPLTQELAAIGITPAASD
jgi:hypothetical protein